MPEMRAETDREARRKGLVSEKATDPTDLTGMSEPPTLPPSSSGHTAEEEVLAEKEHAAKRP